MSFERAHQSLNAPDFNERVVIFRTRMLRLWPVVSLSLAGLSLAPYALAGAPLPQGGHFVSGSGSIASNGSGLVITQSGSARGVVDWRSFSIDKNNSVIINNGTGATLNRVTGGTPSSILGSLTATGSVYLINPQGIVVGSSGVISTGGRFVASTLDMPNADFVKGGTLTLSGTSNAAVVNLGAISSSGGDVFLIARNSVVNGGTVSAPNGTAEYAAGQQVILYESSNSRQVFVQVASHGTVVDQGVTHAAQINLEAADGNIFALAGGGTRTRATGTATRDGHIWLVADPGQVTQQGTVTATNADGSGGTVDTLAKTLTLAPDATVHAGLWNVSIPSFTIDSNTSGAIIRSLNTGTSMNVAATGSNGGNGDLNVASNLTWQGPAALSLVAAHSVTVASGTTIKNTGGGNLSLRADAAAIDNNGSVTNQGTVDWSGSTGVVQSFYDMSGSYTPGTVIQNTAWTSPPESGLVTQVSAYKLVNSSPDLQNLSLDLSGNYALGKDIDANGFAMGPIGNINTPFTGQFDGMWHTIANAAPTVTDFGTNRNAGLFGVIGSAGVVRNVGVVDGKVGLAPGGSGILAGKNQGTIVNAYTTGSVSDLHQDSNEFGGLVGVNEGHIARSWTSANVTGDNVNGGFVGVNSGTITQSYATGTVTSEFSTASAGGFVGVNTGIISQSFATGQVGYARFGSGGFANNNNTGTIALDVFWNKETTMQAQGVIAGTPLPATNGLTTAQMSVAASFGPTYDFSATGVWSLPAGATHPVLRWQETH